MFGKKLEECTVLVCPSCDGKTKVKTQEGVKCTQCDESFKGLTFKRKKYLTRAAAVLVVSGAISGITLSEYVEDERLAYESEYLLMSACVNRSGSTYRRSDLENRIEACACAIRNSVNELGVDSSRDDPDEVIEAFLYDVNRELKGC